MNAAPAEPAAPSPAPGGPAPKGSPKARAMTRAAVRLALPFLLWLGVMMVSQLMHLTPSSLEASKDSENVVEAGASVISDAGLYALRTGLTLLALLVLRPWKYFPAPRLRNLPAALAVGVLVFALWVVPGADWFRRLCPALADLYESWCVRSPGELRDLAAEASRTAALYAPSATGWPLFAVHMLGTGVAIALAEEFFWRGYLLRAARTPDFLDLPIGEFHALSFLEERGEHYDAVITLQPTSPMRTAEDLTGGIKMYDEYDCDSLIAVYEDVKANGFNYYRMGENNAGIAEHREHNTGIRRQDMKPMYIRNGALYISSNSLLKNRKLIIGDIPLLYVMPKERSVDVDSMQDFEYVEWLMKKNS